MQRLNNQRGSFYAEYAIAAAVLIGSVLLIGTPTFRNVITNRVKSSIGIINGHSGMAPCAMQSGQNDSQSTMGMSVLGSDGASQECF